MAAPIYVQALATIAFGALAGGLTNAVAIWMLFHPYEPRGWWRLRLQGAIPKNKARLAKSIGKLVGGRLLTSKDLADQIATPQMRAAFHDALARSVNQFLVTDLGTVRDILPDSILGEFEEVLRGLGPALASRLAEFAESPDFTEAVRRFLERAQHEVGDRPLAEVLTEARREALRERVTGWISEITNSPEVEHAVSEFVARHMSRFAEDHAPLIERLPTGLVAPLERAIADYLPIAIERLGGALTDRTTRARWIKTLRQLLDHAVRDLLLHERIVAKLVVTEKTIERVLSGLEGEGIMRLGEMLEDADVQAQMARAINDAVVRFLRTPLSERIAALGPQRRRGLEQAASDYILSALRDPETQARTVQALDTALEKAEQRSWGDLLEKLRPDVAARWLADALGAEHSQYWIAQATDQIVHTLMDRPIGRAARLLPEGSGPRITAALTESLWDWIQRQVPGVVAQLGVPEMVEQKVLGFSTELLEDLIRRVTERELTVIIRLGYVLGAFVGTVAFLVGMALR